MRRVFAPLVPFGRPSKIAWSNGWTSPLVSLFCGTVTYIKVIERSGGRSPKDLTKRKSQVNKMIGKWKANHYVPIFLVYFLYRFYIVLFFLICQVLTKVEQHPGGQTWSFFSSQLGSSSRRHHLNVRKREKVHLKSGMFSLHRFHSGHWKRGHINDTLKGTVDFWWRKVLVLRNKQHGLDGKNHFGRMNTVEVLEYFWGNSWSEPHSVTWFWSSIGSEWIHMESSVRHSMLPFLSQESSHGEMRFFH